MKARLENGAWFFESTFEFTQLSRGWHRGFCGNTLALSVVLQYTITEDYALGMELKKRNYKGSYLLDYIAEGEAPDEVRNVMRQRSRWCKGHMQVSSQLSSVGFQRCRLFSLQRFGRL